MPKRRPRPTPNRDYNVGWACADHGLFANDPEEIEHRTRMREFYARRRT